MCLCGFFFSFFLKLSFGGKLLSCFTLTVQIKCMKGQLIAKITRIFAQNLGQAPKEAEFYSFSNAIIFFHYETIWIAIELTSVTENPLANPTQSWCLQWQRLANFSNFRTGEEAMVWCGTPIMTGLFLGHGWWVPTAEQTGFISVLQKQHEAKVSTQISLRVRRLKFLGVNCQVGQHSSLSCNFASFLQRGFYAGRGAEAKQPN